MFTGIITDIGTVQAIEKRGDTRIVIETRFDADSIDMGASIACSGACMTVVDKGKSSVELSWFAVDVSAESLSRTTLGGWEVGTRLNLERSMKLGDEIGGHLVTGHVDGLATLVSIIPEGDSHRLKIRVPSGLDAYVAEKGSVALDGVSLTVNEVEGDVFGVNIIPHTWNETTLGGLTIGAEMNMEVDPLARYVARQFETHAARLGSKGS